MGSDWNFKIQGSNKMNKNFDVSINKYKFDSMFICIQEIINFRDIIKTT